MMFRFIISLANCILLRPASRRPATLYVLTNEGMASEGGSLTFWRRRTPWLSLEPLRDTSPG